jgi:hypothetical protein
MMRNRASPRHAVTLEPLAELTGEGLRPKCDEHRTVFEAARGRTQNSETRHSRPIGRFVGLYKARRYTKVSMPTGAIQRSAVSCFFFPIIFPFFSISSSLSLSLFRVSLC